MGPQKISWTIEIFRLFFGCFLFFSDDFFRWIFQKWRRFWQFRSVEVCEKIQLTGLRLFFFSERQWEEMIDESGCEVYVTLWLEVEVEDFDLYYDNEWRIFWSVYLGSIIFFLKYFFSQPQFSCFSRFLIELVFY